MAAWPSSIRSAPRWLVLQAAALLAAGACGDDPAIKDDPRARGRSDFTSALPGQNAQPSIGGGPGPSIPRESPHYLAGGALTHLVGSTLVTINEYRGLQVLDVAGTRPERLSRVPMPGRPIALFMDGELAIAVIADAELTHGCNGCPPDGRMAGSRVYLTNLADRRAPVTLSPIDVVGSVIAARLRGKTLDLVSRGPLETMPPGSPAQPATLVQSLDLADPARPNIVRDLRIPGPEWADTLHFAGDTLYLALYGARRWIGGACVDAPPTGPAGTTLSQGCSRIAAVDLSTTMPVLAASVELRGRVVPGGLHRFGDVVSVLGEATTDQAKPPMDPRPPTLINLRASVPTSLTTIGELALPLGRNGIPPRFRFDAGRLFLATDDATTPLIVVQGTAGTAPTITRRLPAGSIVSEISHIEGDRLLVTEQQVRDGQCPVRALSLHQLGAGDQLSLLARTPVPFEADGGVTVLGGGLMAQAGRDINEVDGIRAPRIALQLFDLDLAAGTLAPRGRVVLTGATLDSVLAASPARLVALSSERAETIDATDRGSPRTEGALDLARWIQDVRFAGGHAVTLVNNDFGGGGFLHLSPADDPDAARPLATWPLEGQVGRLFTHDRFVYLFWHASRRVGQSDPRLDVFEVEGSSLRHRSSRSLDGPARLALASENDGDGPAGQGLRQISGTTFVATLSKVSDCSPGGAMTGGSSMPGRAGTCAPAAPPEPAQLPAALAIADSPGVAETRSMLDGACPGSGADLMVIDVRDPDEPRIASLVKLAGIGELGASVIQGNTLFVLQNEVTELSPLGGPGSRLIRSFVYELNVEDPAMPRLGPRVNVPGYFLAARPETSTWFTAEPRFDSEGKPTAVEIVALYHPNGTPRAYEERRLVLPGTASEPVIHGTTLLVTVDGSLVALDLEAPSAPAELSRTPVAGENPSMHRAVGQHAFVLVGRAMRVFDVHDPRNPRLLDHIVSTPRGAHQVRLAPGNRAVVPRAEWGVAIIDLQEVPAGAMAP